MGDWVDFAALKRSVPLESLLRHYGVELRRSGRDQYRGRCPIHHGEGSEAFHANLARNVFHCFACGAGGSALDFVAAIEGCTLREAALHLQNAAWPARRRSAAGAAQQLVTEKRSTPAPLAFQLRGVDCSHPYLAARGIDPRTAAQFGVGFYRGPGLLSGRVVIPIHNHHGELVAYCGRAVNQSAPRYRFPLGFAKSEILFNLHRALVPAQASVVVVEGFFDCLKVHQAGFPSVVALMGAALYQPQRHRLQESFPHVILMLDGDSTGQRATATIASQLRSHCRVDVIYLPTPLQPDQLATDEICRRLQPHLKPAALNRVP